jgi:DNA-binding LytR/AlgR family response regulator
MPSSKGKNVMIVEDEVLISDMLRHHLTRHGYSVVGDAISYNEAVELYERTQPDIVLLDIQLSGMKTGIDFAGYLRSKPAPPPFIFLTSQVNDHFLDLAKETKPAGYLSKPLQIASLLASIKVSLFNAASFHEPVETIKLQYRGVSQVVPIKNIQYLVAEHVYIRFVLNMGQEVLQRGTLSEMLKRLNDENFVQTHRSYIVNTREVTGFDTSSIYFGESRVPISRNRRQAVFALLE